MKPYLQECAIVRKNMIINTLSNNFLTKCLIKTGHYTHACVNNNETHVGIYYTTTKQSNISIIPINHIETSYSYGILTHNKKIICQYNEILNSRLRNILDKWGIMDNLKYHYILSTNNTLLGTQCKNFLPRYGSIEHIRMALNFNNKLIIFYNNVTNLLEKLEKSDYSQRKYIITQNMDIYDKLKEYAELDSSANDDPYLYGLLYKIDCLLK